MNTLKKLQELFSRDICRNRLHNPPTHIDLKPGVYEYTCPSCGKVVVFTVPSITYYN